MYCSYCGNELDENANFCKYCGAKHCETSGSDVKSLATNDERPLSFEEYLEKKSVPGPSGSGEKVGTSVFKTIKKRKKNERLNQIKTDKKDEIVKV